MTAEDPHATVGGVLRQLVPLLRPYPWAIPVIVVLGLLTSLAEGIGLSLFIPLLQSAGGLAADDTWYVDVLQRAFDGFDEEQLLWAVSACIFVAIVVRAVLAYLNRVVLAWLEARVAHRLRSECFEQLLAVEFRFLERAKVGNLVNTIATETWRTTDAVGVLVGLIVTLCTVLVYSGLLLLLSVPLTLTVAAAMLGIAGGVRLLTRRVRGLAAQVTTANAQLAERMVEGISLMAVIRSFGRESSEKQRFDERSEHVRAVSMRVALLSGAVRPVYEVLSGALLVGVLMLVIDDPEMLPALMVFVFVLFRLQPKLTELDEAWVRLKALSGAVRDVTRLLDRSDKPYLTPGTVEPDAVRTAVEFESVTFRYAPNEAAALEDASFQIPAGRVTALVGPSGAGKTTVIKLLLRLYDPTAGVVTVDGRPLQELLHRSWLERIALVSQDVQLFDASVRDNIAYGAPGAAVDDIEEAARRADAHDFIVRLPHGYDTEVGAHGVRLSGGQQQRITLARALIRDPDVLILDEATNSLDSRSERVVQDALELMRHGRTVVIVAHRFSTIEQADHVVVLDEGRVVQQGKRAALVANDGLFRELQKLQANGAQR